MEKIVTARLGDGVYQRLKELARREDRSVSWIIRRAVEEFVKLPKMRASQ